MKKKTEQQQKREEEAQLMDRIAARDHLAFEEFAKQYKALIFSTVFKVLNHYEDTEDVVNEVLTTIWKKAETFKSRKGSLVTWICTTSRNRAIDRVRSVQRRCALYDRFEEKVEAEIPEKRSSGRDELYRSDARNVLQSAVVSLTDEQRQVIELAYFEGLTQKQIANRIHSPLGTVKARIRRGVERLRGSLSEKLRGESDLLISSLSRR